MAKDTGKKIAVGALVVGLIGYIAGILTAPRSGKETRQEIKDGTIKAKTEAEKKLKVIHSELHSGLIEARKQANKLSGKAKAELDKVIDSSSVAKEKVRGVISAIHEGDPDDPDLKKALKDAQSALKNLEKYVKD